jgi:integrase
VNAAAAPPPRVVVEMECGILVYPPQQEGEPWRAAFTENGQRRFRQAMTEAGLAAKLAKVTERLATRAPNLEQPGSALIAHYLDPDRLPVTERWSRKHADTQTRLCTRFAEPVIAAVTCQDITVAHMQQIVDSAPTAKEGDRLRRCLSAMVTAGLKGGYLVSPQLREVHWKPAGRPVPEPKPAESGESDLWVDPGEIPSHADVDALGKTLAQGRRGDLMELMEETAAYAGLRQGEEFALTIFQVTTEEREIRVDRKVVEVKGKQYLERPKGRKNRTTIYPVRTPAGYPLAAKIDARIEEARDEMARGLNPLGLMFPSPRFKMWRSSNFDRRVLAPAYVIAGWREEDQDEDRDGDWTWHSLRHVFCTTALFGWRLEATDVARMAGHANSRITWDMYVGATAGVLDRARKATSGHPDDSQNVQDRAPDGVVGQPVAGEHRGQHWQHAHPSAPRSGGLLRRGRSAGLSAAACRQRPAARESR